MDLLNMIVDPRKPRGVRHPVTMIVAIAVFAWHGRSAIQPRYVCLEGRALSRPLPRDCARYGNLLVFRIIGISTRL
jgi:hypothetical protein